MAQLGEKKKFRVIIPPLIKRGRPEWRGWNFVWKIKNTLLGCPADNLIIETTEQ